jgi:NAD(P)-dependent dehydrogenase (short-subunit alcohol dehydrogenase family)
MSAYSASKFGLRGFFESLRGELSVYPNIHVCDLYPAFLDTPGMQQAANYTGRELKPAPPLSDPREVARVVVSLVHHPKEKSTVGISSQILRLGYGLFPRLSRNITASTIRTYLHNAASTEVTSGNVLEPVGYGTGIDGGWRTTSIKPRHKKGLLLAGVLVALVLLGRRE